MSGARYMIIRHYYQEGSGIVKARGLTVWEAREWILNDAASPSAGWVDTYEVERDPVQDGTAERYSIVQHWNLSHDPPSAGIVIRRGLTLAQAKEWFILERPDDDMFYTYHVEGDSGAE